MGIIRPYGKCHPQLGERIWVAETAAIVGDVELGDDCGVWYGVVLRGDVNWIRLGARVNVQDNSVVHTVRHKYPALIGDDVTIGHGAVVHGCTVEAGALIGIGALVLDGARVGAGAVVAAGAVVTPKAVVPPRSLVMGTPARVVRELSDEELAYHQETAANYVLLAEEYRTGKGRPPR